MGLIIGLIITPLLNSQKAIWILFFVFTFFHLFANYKAVSCIVFSTFNRQRASIAITHYCKDLLSPVSHNSILSPKEIAQRERVLPIPSWSPIVLAGRLSNLKMDNLRKFGKYLFYSFSKFMLYKNIPEELAKLFKNEKYLLQIKDSSKIVIVLRKSATPIDVLKSYFHAEVSICSLNSHF